MGPLARAVMLGQTVLLAIVAVFLWGDTRARREEAARWRALEDQVGACTRAAVPLPVLPALAGVDRYAFARQVASLIDCTPPGAAPAPAPCASETTGAAGTEAPAKLAPGPEAERRAREAEEIVAAVLASGRLRIDDTLQLRNLESGSQGHPAFGGMRDRIVAAINDQRLQPEDLAFISF